MTAYTRDELFAIAAAAATGAASPDEVSALEAAMPGDPELRAEVELNRRALEAMVGVQAVAPSDLVRGRLLAQARAEADDAHSAATPRSAPDRSAKPAQRPVRNTVFMAVCAASLAVMLGMGAEILRLRGIVSGQTEFVRALQTQLSGREETLNQMLLAENHLRVVHLLTADTVTGPGIQVYWDRAKGTAVVHAFRLPPAPVGQHYQLWAINGRGARSIAAFDSEAGGHALVSEVQIPTEMVGISRMAVTIEPVAGSAQPTTQPVVLAEVRGT